MRRILTTLVAAVVLAGCSSDGGDEQPADATTSTDGYSGGDPANVTAGPPMDNMTGETNTTWQHDSRTGSLSGTGAVVTGGSETEESFAVANGTVRLLVNLTIDGDDVAWAVREPGCADDDCESELTFSQDNAAFAKETPAEGEWTFVLRSDTMVGPYSSEYMLDAALLVPEPTF